MASKTHCDRCDRVVDAEEVPAIQKVGLQLFLRDKRRSFDLCLACTTELKIFMRIAEPKKPQPQQQEKLKND